MALDPKLAVMAVKAAKSGRLRKTVITVLFMSLGIVLLVFVTFSGFISGLLSVVENSDLTARWRYIRETLSDIFSGIECEIDSGVKNEAYDFMPEFSINLSKAAINSGFDGNSLILYDDDEINRARTIMTEYARELREITSSERLSEYLEDYPDADISFSAISSAEFADDAGIDGIADYDESVTSFLYARAMEKMPKYEYAYEERDVDGKHAKTQTLVVTDGYGKTRTVEYICIGGGEIYLPSFLAMYNVRQTREFLIAADENSAEAPDAQIAEAVGNIPETAEEAEKYFESAWQGITDGKGAIKLNIFEVSNLKILIESSVNSGAASISTERTEDRLTITLETAEEDMWRELFEIDEEREKYVEEARNAIELALKNAEIPEEEWTVSLDNMVQLSLFVYFEGFFELPVDSSDLAAGTNGILSQYGDVSKIHRYQYGSKDLGVPEKGITLQLRSGRTPVYAKPLNCGNCIIDSVIYDVWDMENGNHIVETLRESEVFNYSAVTIAYVVDTVQFEEDYGFPFPQINGVSDTGTLTLFLEFTCLDELNLTENDIGSSLYDVTESGLVGYSHSGNYSYERDAGSWRHSIDRDENIPHAGIKTYFMSGEVNVTVPDGAHSYKGPGAANIGVSSNPGLWFKGFRTEMDDKLFETLSAAEP